MIPERKLILNQAILTATSFSDFLRLSKLKIPQSKEMYQKAIDVAKSYSDFKSLGKDEEAYKVRETRNFHDEVMFGLNPNEQDAEFDQDEFDEVAKELIADYDSEFILDTALEFHEDSIEIDRDDDYSYDIASELYRQWRYRLVGLAISKAKKLSEFRYIKGESELLFDEVLSLKEMKSSISDEIIPPSKYEDISSNDAYHIVDKGLAWLYSQMPQYHDDSYITNKAVRQDGNALKYASDRLKDDNHIVATALRKTPSALEYVSKRLKNNKELVSYSSKRLIAI